MEEEQVDGGQWAWLELDCLARSVINCTVTTGYQMKIDQISENSYFSKLIHTVKQATMTLI